MACVHDPLWDYAPENLDDISITGKQVGIACTGIAFFPEWVNEHPCPKVILHRPRYQIETSLRKLSLPMPPDALFHRLWLIRGMHVYWRDLFGRGARDIHAHLGLGSFDTERHDRLKSLTVTANWWERKQNQAVRKRIEERIACGIS